MRAAVLAALGGSSALVKNVLPKLSSGAVGSGWKFGSRVKWLCVRGKEVWGSLDWLRPLPDEASG